MRVWLAAIPCLSLHWRDFDLFACLSSPLDGHPSPSCQQFVQLQEQIRAQIMQMYYSAPPPNTLGSRDDSDWHQGGGVVRAQYCDAGVQTESPVSPPRQIKGFGARRNRLRGLWARCDNSRGLWVRRNKSIGLRVRRNKSIGLRVHHNSMRGLSVRRNQSKCLWVRCNTSTDLWAHGNKSKGLWVCCNNFKGLRVHHSKSTGLWAQRNTLWGLWVRHNKTKAQSVTYQTGRYEHQIWIQRAIPRRVVELRHILRQRITIRQFWSGQLWASSRPDAVHVCVVLAETALEQEVARAHWPASMLTVVCSLKPHGGTTRCSTPAELDLQRHVCCLQSRAASWYCLWCGLSMWTHSSWKAFSAAMSGPRIRTRYCRIHGRMMRSSTRICRI